LRAPWVFSLPIALYTSCFVLPSPALPWLTLALAVLNGALDGVHRAEWDEQCIFWEDSVGESTIPKGPIAKMRLLAAMMERGQVMLGSAATAVEKAKNLLNWSEPPVTVVSIGILAFVATLASIVLLVVPHEVLWFGIGMLCLSPYLMDAGSMQRPPKTRPSATAAGIGGEDEDHSGEEESVTASRTSQQRQRLGLAQMAWRVLARCPDSRDLAHRHFALREQLIDAEDIPLEWPTMPVTTAPTAKRSSVSSRASSASRMSEG